MQGCGTGPRPLPARVRFPDFLPAKLDRKTMP